MADVPLPRLIHLQGGARYLRIQFTDESQALGPSCTAWRLWLAANEDFTLGHFIELCDNGMMFKIVWHEDGGVSIMNIGIGDDQ